MSVTREQIPGDQITAPVYTGIAQWIEYLVELLLASKVVLVELLLSAKVVLKLLLLSALLFLSSQPFLLLTMQFLLWQQEHHKTQENMADLFN